MNSYLTAQQLIEHFYATRPDVCAYCMHTNDISNMLNKCVYLSQFVKGEKVTVHGISYRKTKDVLYGGWAKETQSTNPNSRLN